MNPKVNQDIALEPKSDQQKADKAAADRKKEIETIKHLFDSFKDKALNPSKFNEKYQAIKPPLSPKIGGAE